MDEQREIEAILMEKIKPYEAKIKELEEIERSKDEEIENLKISIKKLHSLLETIKQEKCFASLAK